MPKDNILDFESCALCHQTYPPNGVRRIHDFGEVVFSTCPDCSVIIGLYGNVSCDIMPVDATCPQCLNDCEFGVVFQRFNLNDDIVGTKVKCVSPMPIALDTAGKCFNYKEAKTNDDH